MGNRQTMEQWEWINMDRLKQQMEFMQEIDKLKNIGRQSYITDGKKKENDAEHSWHLAMMAMLLSEYSNEKIDVLRVMSMVLIHDLVEIDAGDTYAYDTEGNKTKRLREEKAADRIFNIFGKYSKQQWLLQWECRRYHETDTAIAGWVNCDIIAGLFLGGKFVSFTNYPIKNFGVYC